MFDYSKTYYKVTNSNECHKGYQYHDGLNILKEPFDSNPSHSCTKGGFYFTDFEHLILFFNYGVYIREVTIPKNARVIKDPKKDKWRTDKIIFGKKYEIKKHFTKWFNPELFDWKNSWMLAQHCSEHFDQWFDPNKFNWADSWALAMYCSKDFDKWFNPKLFKWSFVWVLAEHCSDYFEKWFKPRKIDWKTDLYFLEEYCSEYKSIWKKYIPKKILRQLNKGK